MLLVDLDGIRAVNQVLGHAIGEDLLRAAARRLQAAVRDGDLVSRMAGEEFAVLQCEVTDPAHAAALAARLVDLLGRAYLIAGETVVIIAAHRHRAGPDRRRRGRRCCCAAPPWPGTTRRPRARAAGAASAPRWMPAGRRRG